MSAFNRVAVAIGGLAAISVAHAANKPDASERQPVAIRFALTAGDQPVECGRDIAGLGAGGQPAQLRDARFYISAPALIDAAGREVPIELEQNDWQYANLALLDFENKTGKCIGSADVNDTIKGSAPRGRYKGISFVIGVPSVGQDKDGKDVVLNHSNFATAPAPLDLQSMTWNWQAGRKFVKIEVDPEGGVTRPPLKPKSPADAANGAGAPGDKSDGGAPPMADAPKAAPLRVNEDGTITVSTWMLHLGSTGCRGDAVEGRNHLLHESQSDSRQARLLQFCATARRAGSEAALRRHRSWQGQGILDRLHERSGRSGMRADVRKSRASAQGNRA